MKLSSMNVTTCSLCAILLAVLVNQLGCNLFHGKPNEELCNPHSDLDILASMAITRAVIKPGDIPDVNLLDRNPAIILATATRYITIQGEAVDTFLTECSLPHKRSVRFMLLTLEQIQALADDHGSFVYLFISEIKETSEGAVVTISTTWAVGKDSHMGGIVSGGGYLLLLRKDGSKWSFNKMGDKWIS